MPEPELGQAAEPAAAAVAAVGGFVPAAGAGRPVSVGGITVFGGRK